MLMMHKVSTGQRPTYPLPCPPPRPHPQALEQLEISAKEAHCMASMSLPAMKPSFSDDNPQQASL